MEYDYVRKIFYFSDLTDLGLQHGFTGKEFLPVSGQKPEALLGNLLERDVFVLNQVHSDLYVLAEGGAKPQKQDGDGFIIGQKAAKGAYTVKTADCAPVIIKAKDVSCILHCGWRGIAAGFVQKALSSISKISSLDGVIICVGPCAEECCYEVGKEVIAQIGPCAAVSKRGGRESLSLSQTILNMVSDFLPYRSYTFYRSGICTICDERFFSYRREGKQTGRNLAFIAY